jgi:transcriptional regulator with XRE-family HTH domain
MKSLPDPREIRIASGLNQQTFWAALGVTQSGGSRYENRRRLPRPLQILLWLYVTKRLTLDELLEAKQVLRL